MRLENKVAIITGAASETGETIAKLYAKEGAKEPKKSLQKPQMKEV